MTSSELDRELWNADEIPLVESEAVYRMIQEYKMKSKRFWLIIILQWLIVASLLTILVAVLVVIRHDEHYWIPNELYCKIPISLAIAMSQC